MAGVHSAGAIAPDVPRGSWSVALVRVCRGVVGVVLLAAAVGKFLSLEPAVIHSRSWRIVPDDLAFAVVVSAICLEAFTGVACLASTARARIPVVLAGLVVVLATLAATAERVMNGAVSCECFGELSWLNADRYDHLLHRNAALVGLLIPPYLAARGGGRRDTGASRSWSLLSSSA